MSRFIKSLLILCVLSMQVACKSEIPTVDPSAKYNAKCFSGGVIIYERNGVKHQQYGYGAARFFETDTGIDTIVHGDCVISMASKGQ